MKKLVILSLILSAVMLHGIRNWKTHTNTTHLFDLYEQDGTIYMATWGGFVIFDIASGEFVQTFTNVDGLASQDIRALAGFDDAGEILVGTNSGGLERYCDGDFDIPLTSTTGLISEKVQDVETYGNQLFVATNEGLSVFTNDADFPMPLKTNDFTSLNGLSSSDIQEIELTQDGYLVCASVEGIDYCHVDSLLQVSYWNHISYNMFVTNSTISPSDLSVKGNKLAITSDKGLFCFDNFPHSLDFVRYSDDNVLLSNETYPVYIDDELNVWFSYGTWDNTSLLLVDTLSTAVVKMSPDGEMTTWDNTQISTKIMGFTKIDGRIATWTWGDGFYLMGDEGWINFKPQSIIANTVTAMAVDQKGKVWIVNGYRGSGTTSRGTRGVSGYDVNNDSWENFDVENSPLLSNNMFSVGVDSHNRKCFGTWSSAVAGWDEGISVYDDSMNEPTWSTITSGLMNTTISFITSDPGNRSGYNADLWACSYGNSGGVSVLNNGSVISTFAIPDMSLADPITAYIGKDKLMFGSYHNGLRIYEGNGIPIDDSIEGWSAPDFSELENSGRIYAITYRENDWESEYWVASSNGLFVLDEFDNWYSLGISIKREKWDGNSWEVYQRYFENEQRLYGSITTIPTALLTDPFDRVWIGTESNGITIYDGDTDTYTTYNTDNAPLLSNYITAFAYEPISGRMFIGTPEGLNSVEIGLTHNPVKTIHDNVVTAFPNPYYPETSTADYMMIVNGKPAIGTIPGSSYAFPANTKCNIYDLSGRHILTIRQNYFGFFEWNGNNEAGKKCSSGIYYYVVYNGDGQVDKGTISLIR